MRSAKLRTIAVSERVPSMRGSTLNDGAAMIVNSGVDDFSSYTYPDNNIGWGRVLLDEVLYFPGDSRRTVVVDDCREVFPAIAIIAAVNTDICS